MHRWTTTTIPLAMALGLALPGCAAVKQSDYPLAVQIADLRFAEPGLLEQSIGLDLRFTNPNPEPIQARGLRFVVELEGSRFGTGVSDAAFEIPRLGEAVVPLTIRVQTGTLINRLLAIEAGELDYRISGDLFQPAGLGSSPLPFVGASAIVVPDLPALLRGQERP